MGNGDVAAHQRLAGATGAQGRRAADLDAVDASPGVVAVMRPDRERFDTAMADARERGVVTPELRAAFADPAVRYAHWYEALAVAVVIGLMILKPF
jgi:hypothetical protein